MAYSANDCLLRIYQYLPSMFDAAVMLKDASNGCVATGKIKRSKADVHIVCVRTMRTTLTTTGKRISTVFNVFINLRF